MKTKTMNQSRLVQRLHKPSGAYNPFSFGGGLRNGGLSDKAMGLLGMVLSFDYMGAAEFEFGAIPKALEGLAADYKRLTSYEVEVEGVPVFVLCRPEHAETVNARLAVWGTVPYPEMKAHLGFFQALHPERDWHSKTCGWLELDNGFFFFTDREMWSGVSLLFGVGVS